jgi:acyl carrier protein
MSTLNTAGQIRQFLRRNFPSARHHPLAEEDQLLANGVLDSLGVLELVGYLEQEFGITVSDDDLVPVHFETLKRVAAFVEERQRVGSR